ncbi:MAG: hypothetical protein PHY77_03705 [Desulfotomaculaceae bacterium]|nr:hypothetical protein [Desulfotomaculaceae bacterium]
MRGTTLLASKSGSLLYCLKKQGIITVPKPARLTALFSLRLRGDIGTCLEAPVFS